MNKIIALAFTFVLIACQVQKKTDDTVYIADHRTATNTFTIATSNSGVLKTGDLLTFTLSFPSNIILSGNPRLQLRIGSNNRYANYVSGGGSKILTFNYTIIATDNDSDGIEFSSIDLNGATLQFNLKDVLTNCSTSIAATHYPQIIIDNTSPLISSISHSHALGIYYWNDVLTFAVNFNERVFVTGTPTLPLTFDIGGARQAQYVSGSGTPSLIFKYTIANDVRDVNGLGFATTPLVLGAGSIKDNNGNDAELTLPGTIAPTDFLRIDGRLPKIEEVILPANGTYRASQQLDFTVVFDRPVNIIGSPHLLLTVGSNNLQANYLAGSGSSSLTFRYNPIPGHADLDGITLNNSIVLPGYPATTDIRAVSGALSVNYETGNNNLKSPDTSGILVSATLPAIERISRAADSTLSVNGGASDNVWIIGQQLHLIAEFNTEIIVNIDAGAPTLNFSIGGVPKVATYLTGGAGTSSITFLYTVLEGDQSTGDTINFTNIQLNNAVITDTANTVPDYTIPNTTLAQTTIDGIRPTLNNITPPTDGFYSRLHTTAANQSLYVTANFSEAVNLSNTAIGIDMIIGATARRATLNTNNNSAAPVFRYTLVNIDNDSDGISIQSPLNMGSYRIRDLAGNDIQGVTFSPPLTPAVIVDNIAPTVSVTAQPASRLYLRGETLILELTFNEIVSINSTGPYPRIPIANLAPARYFIPDFSGLVQGTVFSFRYDIQPGDLATTAISLGAIDQGGGSYIRDRATNNLNPTPAPSLSSAITIDAVEVRVNSTAVSTAAHYRVGDTLNIDLNFSEAVFLTGTPLLTTTVSGVDFDFACNSGSGTSTIRCSHTITDGTLRLAGLGSVGTIDLNGGAIRDNNDIDATLSFTSRSLAGLKIVPTKFLSWSQGTTTDILSNSTQFNGSFNLTGTESLSATASGSTIITRVRFDSATGSILGGINYTTGTEITLSSTSIQSLRVNGTVINPVLFDYDLGVNTGDTFILEIELATPAANILFDPDFMGQVRSILLLSSPLSASERSEVYPLLN